jgi:general secretion pathway protein D
MRWVSLASSLAAAMVLAGCAAQSAFREGQDFVQRGQTQQGMAKLQEAIALEPTSAEYRLAYLRARDRAVATAIEESQRQLAQGRPDAAEAQARQALAIDGSNDAALAMLRRVELQRRQDARLRLAEEAWRRGDADAASTAVRAVLVESPAHARALTLKREIDEKAAKPPPQAHLAAAYRNVMSIEFKETPVRTVFEVISRTSGLNFVFDKDVRGDQKTTIYLRNTTVESAIALVLLTNQLEQRILDGNSILIYPSTPAKLKDYQPLTVRTFYLANADAKVVANTVKTILKTRDLVIDEKLNFLIVRDSPEAVRLIEKLVALHDVPEPELMLEVEILEVKRSRLLDLGVRWPDQLTLTPLPSATGAPLTLADLRNLNSSTVGATVGGVTVNARRQDTDANLLANPRIRARNREKAKILIGERVPNISTTSTSTGFVSESVTYVDVGLKLDVEPIVYPDGEVVLKMSLEVSNIVSQVQTKSGTLAYQIGTRTATSVLRVRDGENQVLAGLINDEDRRSANKVPGLGEVPIIGRLFGSQADDNIKTEIVLSITPRILRNIPKREAADLEFDSGTESNVGQRAGAPAGVSPVASRDRASPPPPAATPARQGSTPGASIAAAALPSTAVAIQWQGPAQVRSGETFAMELRMQSAQPVNNVPLTLGFDPQLVQVVGVAEGEFLRQGGATTSFGSRVDARGQVSITATRNADSGAAGAGVLATINLRAVGQPGSSTGIRLLTASPSASGQLANVTLPLAHEITITP